MKCESNKIGAWLDDAYMSIVQGSRAPVDMAFYHGAMKVLGVAGFKVDAVPCGRGVIHVVNPPDRIVTSNESQLKISQMKMEV